jgi:IclR family acetate operon transcriptional repressor
MAKATAHRLMSSMVEHGLIQRIDGRRFSLGLRLYELGHLASRERLLRDLALPILGDLFESTGKNVNLAILDQASVIYLVKLTSRSNPQPPSRIGGRLPVHCTAVGKVMLAFLPPSYTETVISAPMPRLTPATITDPAAFVESLKAVRETGIAYDRQELTRGVVCIAAPILGVDGRALAAISVTSREDPKSEQRAMGAVKMSARTLSRQLHEYGLMFQSTDRD